jgi:hypothetical protein
MRTRTVPPLSLPGLFLLLLPGADATRAADPLLPPAQVAALASEVSGAAAYQTAQELTLHHRMRASEGFNAAVEVVRGKLRAAGFEDVEVIRLPADGRFYGTQKSRPAWKVEFAELWEQVGSGEGGGAPWRDRERVASWADAPITLAQDSESGEVAAELVDVGAGTAEADYDGKSVAGKLVLISAQPSAAYALAVDKFGAAGIVSWAQNQRTGWWGEDASLIRWGHLNTFPRPKTFAFMVSPARAKAWSDRLKGGGVVRLRASVRAGQQPGSYDIVSVAIPGADPRSRAEEIAFTCHLDHPRPGANDNASGCSTLVEIARSLRSLVTSRRIEPPQRTIRFYWPPEVEGSLALLNGRPEIAPRTRAVLHLDMVGGRREATKAIFHVTRNPESLPSVVDDVSRSIASWLNEQSANYAATGAADYPLVEGNGTKDPLAADFARFTMGSDHQVWAEGSFRIPAIYLNDWPDRYIHTNADRVENLDPTKLRRVAFLAAGAALYLANLDASRLGGLWPVVRQQALARSAEAVERASRLATVAERSDLLRRFVERERAAWASVRNFAEVPQPIADDARAFFDHLEATLGGPFARPAVEATAAGARVYRRSAAVKGTMDGFGYSWFEDHAAQETLREPALLAHRGPWGGGSEYAYEALNLVDGVRSVDEIRAALAATYGPVDLETVAEYLAALERLGVVTGVTSAPAR